LRITFLCPHLQIAGGVRAILTYADRLVGRGHIVDVIVPERRSGRAFWRTREPPRLAWMSDFRARIRLVPEWAPAELPDADAVVATAWQSAQAVAAASSSRGAKFYLVQHYESLYHGEAGLVDATYRLPLRKIVISSWLRDIMRDRFAYDAEVLVTPVDGGLFHHVPVTSAGPRPRVLMLHHEYPWKGVADGLEAVARARARGARLHLVGFGVKAPRAPMPYDEFHANLPQRDLASLYSGVDIYLCPSWDEGLGMPSMEAMACGAALVTYDNGGCRDYAAEGVTARVARRRDVDDLAAKLASLALEPALRARVAAAGRELITTAFDWDQAVTRMEAILGRTA
jgi:glycosyltransferase involved in cell wall biosynthesis